MINVVSDHHQAPMKPNSTPYPFFNFLSMAFLSFLAFFTFPAFSQNSSTSVSVSPLHHKLLIGISISPDVCYRKLNIANNTPISELILDARNSYEVPKFGYTTGLTASYFFFNHLGLESSLLFSEERYGIDSDKLYFGDQIDPRYGFVYDTIKLDDFRFYWKRLYLDIPIKIVYTVDKRKYGFITGFGIEMNFLLSANQVTVYKFNNEDILYRKFNEYRNYNPLNVSSIVSAGVRYQVTQKFLLSAEPTFRYALLNSAEGAIGEHPWSAGLNFTCYYFLK